MRNWNKTDVWLIVVLVVVCVAIGYVVVHNFDTVMAVRQQ